jgi:hypothetical protein
MRHAAGLDPTTAALGPIEAIGTSAADDDEAGRLCSSIPRTSTAPPNRGALDVSELVAGYQAVPGPSTRPASATLPYRAL